MPRSSSWKDKSRAASQDEATPSEGQLRASPQPPSEGKAQLWAPPQALSEGAAQLWAAAQALSEEKERDQRCSLCAATETPMWRNNAHGNKILCNACGVRLQRQVKKAPPNDSQQGESLNLRRERTEWLCQSLI